MSAVHLTPATPIRLSESKLLSLERHLERLVTDRETQHGPLFEAMEIWEKNYEATPKHKIKSFPFQGASNIVLPIIRTAVDSYVASQWQAIHAYGRKVWSTQTLNEDYELSAKVYATYLNWQADGNDFDFGPITYDWLQEGAIHGSSVLALGWRDTRSHVYVKDGKKLRVQAVSWNTGPILEHVPRHQILWDTSYPSIGVAPDVTRQFVLTWGHLSALARQSDGWLLDNVEMVQNETGLDGPTDSLRAQQAEMDYRANLTTELYEPHDVREITLSWPEINALDIHASDIALPHNKKIDTVEVDICVTQHRKTGKILRLSSQPFLHHTKPFFDFFYKKKSGRGTSVGLAKLLEQEQVGATTIFNQGIDSQTRANSAWAKTNNRDLLEKPIDLSKPIYDPTMNGFEPLALAGSSFGNIQLLQTIQAYSERLSGQADPAFGRETRLGGHSAPATTTLALLERGQTLDGPTRGLLQRTLSRLGEYISVLNQQYEVDPTKLQMVLGQSDAAMAEVLAFPTDPIPGNYKFQIRGLSKSDNPDREVQRQMAVYQQTQTYWSSVLKLTEAIASLKQVQDPEIQAMSGATMVQGLKSFTQNYRRILDAMDIDDVENFILTLDETTGGPHTAEQLTALEGLARDHLGANAPTGEQSPIPVSNIPLGALSPQLPGNSGGPLS